jgi:integrase
MEYHIYNAEEAWEDVSEENKILVKEFMEYVSATDKSPETKRVYIHNLKLFFQWVLNERENKFFAELKKRDFMSWLSYLVDTQKLSPSRVRQLRSTISSLSNFCENVLADEDKRFENYRNLILKIPAPPLESVREITYLSDEQINKLLDWLEEQQAWKDCLYIVLSFYTGARKSEIRQFKISDFTKDTLQNGMYKTSLKRAKGRGKIGKQRYFLIPQEIVDKYLGLYLTTRVDDLDDLFVTKYKGKVNSVSLNTFNHWCDKYSEYLGIPVYPHCYRSSIATILKERGKDPVKIQKMLGHKDISTTMGYIRENDEEDIIDLFQ